MATLKGLCIPPVLYDEYKLKTYHYLAFWWACNILEVNDEEVSHFTREQVVSLLNAHPIPGIRNIFTILETLASEGYLEMEITRGKKHGTLSPLVSHISLRVVPGIWERTEPTTPIPTTKNPYKLPRRPYTKRTA